MRLLVVEDELRLARTLARGFVEEGHQVDVCRTAEEAEVQITALRYDVVILDWMLPDQDGLSLLRAWRARGETVPVLMLTARGAVPERIAGLRAGADDFLPKPFDFEELVARVEALRRRSGDTLEDRSLGDVSLDMRGRALVRDSRRADLTPREHALAEDLFAHAGEVRTRTELLAAVWGPSFSGEPNVVDVYIGYLRRKLADIGATDVVIRTVRRVGFRLEVTR